MTAVRLLGAVFIVLLVCHAAFLDLRDWFRARRACPVHRLAEDQGHYEDEEPLVDTPTRHDHTFQYEPGDNCWRCPCGASRTDEQHRRAEVAALEAVYALPAAVREDGAQ